jgi:predicted peroxiredoxin
MERSTRLVIKLATGIADVERVSQAFTVASTALASGIEVSFWLAGDAAWFALPGKAEEFLLQYAAPISETLQSLIDGGTVTLCSQCAMRRNISDGDQITGIRIAGATSFVEEILREKTQALVY